MQRGLQPASCEPWLKPRLQAEARSTHAVFHSGSAPSERIQQNGLLTCCGVSAKFLAVNQLLHLSRRERQIMDALFRMGAASATEVRAAMPDPPGYSAVRATLRILEEKGAVRHQEQDGKYVYTPAVSRDAARKSAVRSLLTTFFDGSAAQAAVALLGSTKTKLTQHDLDRLTEILEQAKKESAK